MNVHNSSPAMNQDDEKFQKEFEEACRRSLLTYEDEQKQRGLSDQRRSSQPKSVNVHSNSSQNEKSISVNIIPRPRPSSKANQDTPRNTSGTSTATSVTTLGAIPPPTTFKRHKSLPHRHKNPSGKTQLTSQSSEGPPLASSSSNGQSESNTTTPPVSDLISLASPKKGVRKFTNGSFCDTTTIDDWSSITSSTNVSTPTNPSSSNTPLSAEQLFPSIFMSKNPSTNTNNHSSVVVNSSNVSFKSIMANSNNHNNNLDGSQPPPIGFYMCRSLSSSYPSGSSMMTPSTLSDQLTNNNNNNNNNNEVKKIVPDYSALRAQLDPSGSTFSPDRPYKNLAEEVKLLKLKGDLIDLYQTEENSNIVRYFDPLGQRSPVSGAQSDVTEKTNYSPGSSRQSSASEATITPGMSSTTSTIDSRASTATSAFTFVYPEERMEDPRNSLYPTLDEFNFDGESLYGMLTKSMNSAASDRSDVSSLYPSDYVNMVSVSSPSLASGGLYSIGEFPPNDIYSACASPLPIGFVEPYGTTSIGGKPPALPPRNQESPPRRQQGVLSSPELDAVTRRKSKLHEQSKRQGKLYENLESIKQYESIDSEIKAFYEMIREIRLSCRHTDPSTNKGYIRASTIETKSYSEGYSMKFVIHYSESKTPATFTADVSIPPRMIIIQAMEKLDLQDNEANYMLRVRGFNSHLDADADVPIGDYCYVQNCIKLDNDVNLVLVKISEMAKTSWARDAKDDAQAINISIDDILPQVKSKTITYDDLSKFLEVIDKESEKIKEKVIQVASSKKTGQTTSLSTAPLIQPVKGACKILGEVQTVEIKLCADELVSACEQWNTKFKVTSTSPTESKRMVIGQDCGDRMSYVEVSKSTNLDECTKKVTSAVERFEDSVRTLVEMYSKSFPVSFRMKDIKSPTKKESGEGSKSMADIAEHFILRVGAIHRLKNEWLNSYHDYNITAEVFHGTRCMGRTETGPVTLSKSEGNLFFHTLVINKWVKFFHIQVCILPRECRVVFTLYGRRAIGEANEGYETKELGWASMQCFSFKGFLVQGNYLLPLWPPRLPQKRFGPAPNSSFSSDGNEPLLTLEFNDFGSEISFPDIPSYPIESKPQDFSTLDKNTQLQLKECIENNTFSKVPPEHLEVLWEKRHYLYQEPNALPKVLLQAQLWDYASLAEVHAMLRNWRPLDPIDAIQLLLPCFPDSKVREEAVRWISHMPDGELINLLPQMVEALSYETFDFSPLAKFLLRKAISCLEISHNLFWLLASQVGIGKWNVDTDHPHEIVSSPAFDSQEEHIFDPRKRRLELMLNSLMVTCGNKWKQALIAEYKMIEGLRYAAMQVRNTPSSSRNVILADELKRVNHKNRILKSTFGSSDLCPLPLSPKYAVSSVDTKACSYFNSASLPLKVVFNNGLPEGGTFPVLFKVGDDIRQDMLTIQVIRVIEKWWLQNGLDLRVLTFTCSPTGFKQGMVEMIENSETLCNIQRAYGLTGAFRDQPIFEWLQKMNPSALEYRRAIKNFTSSCAAYCVLTYVLGICDRHNDNIMLNKKGHLFHIDFGKFLGDAQMFGNFKRDRTPFVLTSEMIYVINNGEEGSQGFHHFVELCCDAFKIIREHGNVLINLFVLMITANIPGVGQSSLTYLRRALLPECTNVEAAAEFAKFIEDSSQNWFTSVNFFIHSLAQMKFGNSSSSDPNTLSFAPVMYSKETDGHIVSVRVESYEKKYDPEKYYCYSIRIKRENEKDDTIVYRLYKEFLEFYNKLCAQFPNAARALKPLPRSPALMRSNVAQVAAKRKPFLQNFLDSLFALSPEIAHSNLVYTFFHPLLRDEEQHLGDKEEQRKNVQASLKRDPSRIHGQIKLSLDYRKNALLVLVRQATDLACPGGTPPSSYVKTYLRPDPSRVTKRKTKIVKKNQHPTFMEMIEYRLPLEVIRQKVLQVTVWHYDILQENNFLGSVSIPLNTLSFDHEICETYTLGNFVSTA